LIEPGTNYSYAIFVWFAYMLLRMSIWNKMLYYIINQQRLQRRCHVALHFTWYIALLSFIWHGICNHRTSTLCIMRLYFLREWKDHILCFLIESYKFQENVQISTEGTNVVCSNPAHGEMNSIQHYVIKFVSDLRRSVIFCCFLHQWNGPPQYSWNIAKSQYPNPTKGLPSYTLYLFKVLFCTCVLGIFIVSLFLRLNDHVLERCCIFPKTN
jgi:hypothetical protein